jgi:hypothetical protein
MVLFITSIVTLLSFSCWYKASLFLDLVIERETFYTNIYNTERALKEGFCIAKKHFFQYTKTPTIITRHFQDGIFSLSFSKNDTDSLFLRVIYKQGDEELCVLHCNLLKIGQNNDDNAQYMVQNFIIGNIL